MDQEKEGREDPQRKNKVLVPEEGQVPAGQKKTADMHCGFFFFKWVS